MKNPLRKRLPRELKDDVGKYIVIFLFMTLTIGVISGFLVAGGSMKTAYDESFEKYNIEDGHFVLKNEADKNLIKEIEKEFNVKEGHTSKDGKITLDTKNCFKKCGFAPNVQINGKLYSNCSKQNIVKLLKDMIY